MSCRPTHARARSAGAHCLLLLLPAACGSNPPEQVVVGRWGVDPEELQAELAEASKKGRLARSMAEAKAAETLKIRLELGADGKARMVGGGMDGEGTYRIDKVEGDTVTLTIAGEGSLPGTLTFTVRSDDRLTMSDPSRAWELRLLRQP